MAMLHNARDHFTSFSRVRKGTAGAPLKTLHPGYLWLFGRLAPGLAACGVPRTLQERTRRHPAKALEVPREMALVEEANFRRHDRPRHAREQQRLCAPDAHA